MTRRAREIETLLMTMYAALPLYLTGAVGVIPLALFHAVMCGILVRVVAGKGPELVPPRLMRWAALAYVPFYLVDAAFLSRSAIAASTHLVLFIAAYQPVESLQRNNQTQRMLTASLICIASLATSTHVTIVLFIALFGFLIFRQLMYASHLETVTALERPYAQAPAGRAALFYLAGAALIAAVLFPLLPRFRNPFVRGITGSLPGAATALSDTIDFSQPRSTPPDATVVARVWMDREARSFFTPVRLRGNVYERYWAGEWRQAPAGHPERDVAMDGEGRFVIARAAGAEGEATLQLRGRRGKLFLPTGTVAVRGLNRMRFGPANEAYSSPQEGMLNLSVLMAYEAEPLRLQRAGMAGYPISPEVRALAQSIIGNEQSPAGRASRIEQYMISNYRYLPNPVTPGRAKSLDEFLLRDRSGHCEYFAAGMVVLLNAVDVPARIAGGYYGGRENPITGYFTLRSSDAHAWTEVWDGSRWRTYDATPPSLRPGADESGTLGTYLAAVTDSLNFFWDRYVLTFGAGDQILFFEAAFEELRSLLGRLRTGVSASVRGILTREFGLLLALVIAGGFALVLLLRRRDALVTALRAYFAARGVELDDAMTMRDALAVLRDSHPADAAAVEPLVRMYEEQRFSAHATRERNTELLRRLDQLRAG